LKACSIWSSLPLGLNVVSENEYPDSPAILVSYESRAKLVARATRPGLFPDERSAVQLSRRNVGVFRSKLGGEKQSYSSTTN
jgi:hypothetical protein